MMTIQYACAKSAGKRCSDGRMVRNRNLARRILRRAVLYRSVLHAGPAESARRGGRGMNTIRKIVRSLLHKPESKKAYLARIAAEARANSYDPMFAEVKE